MVKVSAYMCIHKNLWVSGQRILERAPTELWEISDEVWYVHLTGSLEASELSFAKLLKSPTNLTRWLNSVYLTLLKEQEMFFKF